MAGLTILNSKFQSYKVENIPRSTIPCDPSFTENIYTACQTLFIEEIPKTEIKWVPQFLHFPLNCPPTEATS